MEYANKVITIYKIKGGKEMKKIDKYTIENIKVPGIV